MADILSQKEIDFLLDIVEGDNDNIFNKNNCKEEKQISLYDFKRPNRVSKKQLRNFREIHEKIVNHLSDKISSRIKSIVEIQLYSVDQMTYGEFLLSLPDSTSFNIFSMKPLNENGVIEVNPSIVFPIIDILLGGEGKNVNIKNNFTNIEIKIFEDILNLIIISIKEGWKSLINFSPIIEKKETNSNITPIVSKNEIVLTIVMEIKIGEHFGMINICYPFISLEKLLNKLSSNDILTDKKIIKDSSTDLNILLSNIEVQCNKIIGEKLISLKDIQNLKIGDILIFEKKDILEIK
jgi:flagellar motor switch protein FliM